MRVFSHAMLFAKVQELKESYRRGGLGDSIVKKYLFEVLNNFLDPIRKRRQEYAADMSYVQQVLAHGTATTREATAQTMDAVRKVMHLDYEF